MEIICQAQFTIQTCPSHTSEPKSELIQFTATLPYIKTYCLCHPSPSPFWTTPTQNRCPTPSIKISFFGNFHQKWVLYVIHQNSFFGNLVSKYVAYVIHHHSPFGQSQTKMGVPCHSSKFPFLEIYTQNGFLMSSIKISFFWKVT